MVRLAADENFNYVIVRCILRRNSEVDIVRIQDAGLSGAGDPAVLEWAAREERVLLTHDVTTVIQAGNPMPGVFEVSRTVFIGLAIDEILLIAEYSLEGEWEGRFATAPVGYTADFASKAGMISSP